MGTTLTAMLFSGDCAALAHIGNSHAFRLRDGRLRQITEDHTIGKLVWDAGFLAPVLARHVDGRPEPGGGLVPVRDLECLHPVAGDYVHGDLDGLAVPGRPADRDDLQDRQGAEVRAVPMFFIQALDLILARTSTNEQTRSSRSAAESSRIGSRQCRAAQRVDVSVGGRGVRGGQGVTECLRLGVGIGLADDCGNYRNARTRIMSLSMEVRADGLLGGLTAIPKLAVKNTSAPATVKTMSVAIRMPVKDPD